MRDETVLADLFRPALEMIGRPISINTSKGEIAKGPDLFQNRRGKFGWNVIRVNQHGEQGAVSGRHTLCLNHKC